MRRLAPALISAALAASAAAQEVNVPLWAEDWRYVWLEAQEHGSLKLTGKVSSPLLAPGRSEVFALIEVTSMNFPQEPRPPVNAAVIIDSSASMKGVRLNVMKKAASDVVRTFKPTDQVALIKTSDETTVLDSMKVTEENRQRMLAFIDEAVSGGGSDLSAGLTDAYAQLLSHRQGYDYHRVVLISDGKPNKGMADPVGLAEIARKVREAENIHTSTFTIGVDSNQELMYGIARDGWGFTGDLEDASHVLRVGRRIEVDLLRRAAEKTELTVKLAPNVSLADLLEHAGTVSGGTVRISLHELANRETLRVILRLHVVNSAPADKPVHLLNAHLAYRDALVDKDREATLALASTSTRDPQAAINAQDPKLMLTVARSVAARALARAQDRFDAGYLDEARGMLVDARAFLERTTQEVGIVTTDEEAALEQLRDRLFPPAKKPPPRKKKGRR